MKICYPNIQHYFSAVEHSPERFIPHTDSGDEITLDIFVLHAALGIGHKSANEGRFGNG